MCRILGERGSLATLLSLLFHSLISRKISTQSCKALEFLSSLETEWEYAFAAQICEHYSCTVWLPSIPLLLQQIGGQRMSHDCGFELLVAINFISNKLQDPELFMVLHSVENSAKIQVLLIFFFLVQLGGCFSITKD